MKLKAFLLPILFLPFVFSCKFGHDNGGDEIESDPWDKKITALVVQENSLWVGTYKNGLYKLVGKKWTRYTISDDLLSNQINALVVDEEGGIWVGTNLGLSKLEDGNWIHITETDGLYSNDVRSLSCDDENCVWIGSIRNRISKFDGANFVDYHINAEASNGGGHIHTLTCDTEENIWVGSCISGLTKFDGTSYVDTINGILLFALSSICTENGDVWIGHSMGVDKLSNGVWVRYTKNEGLASDIVRCFTQDKEHNIWIGTDGGVSKFDGASWSMFTIEHGLPENDIKALACDSNGHIWVGTFSGLAKLDISE